ncbi:uncharacterized protein LOC106867853 [Octopus bimaculoides]|uniref:uncharacterized protein LOC106867853 n=1 Tax=Octopus bimaculoides TaxID=37653 RepID=UPI0022E56DAF|nr:uncharacterized protein LOC106867853 [Octopus bimaculoides]
MNNTTTNNNNSNKNASYNNDKDDDGEEDDDDDVVNDVDVGKNDDDDDVDVDVDVDNMSTGRGEEEDDVGDGNNLDEFRVSSKDVRLCSGVYAPSEDSSCSETAAPAMVTALDSSATSLDQILPVAATGVEFPEPVAQQEPPPQHKAAMSTLLWSRRGSTKDVNNKRSPTWIRLS